MEQLRSFYHEIRDMYGYTVWEDSGRVLAAFKDLAPGKTREYNLLEEICRAGVLPVMAASLKGTPQDCAAAYERAVETLKAGSFISEDVIRETCLDFFAANGMPETELIGAKSNTGSGSTGSAPASHMTQNQPAMSAPAAAQPPVSAINNFTAPVSIPAYQQGSAGVNRNPQRPVREHDPNNPYYRGAGAAQVRTPNVNIPAQGANAPYYGGNNNAIVPPMTAQSVEKVVEFRGAFGPVALFFKAGLYYVLFFLLLALSWTYIHTVDMNVLAIGEGIFYIIVGVAIWSGMSKKSKTTKPSFCLAAGMLGAGTFAIVLPLISIIAAQIQLPEELGVFDNSSANVILWVPGILMSFVYAVAMKRSLARKTKTGR